MTVKTISPVTAYAHQVLDGDVVAGKLVRLACERHLRDLRDGKKRGIHFDEAAAQNAIDFFAFLRHSKGEWAGQPFVLAPWQAFIIGSVFGWKKADGLRRFREGYEEVARKNGKTTQLAGMGLLLAFFDNEPGAEVYFAATLRDQAKLAWGEAKRMVLATPQLRSRVDQLVANLNDPATGSKCEPLGADADNYHGLNIHAGLIDELHAHKTRTMVDVLSTGTGSRRQPLVFAISTSGYDRHSICWEKHDYAVKVLEGVIQDDTFFAYVATLDEGDDWTDPAVWVKANPNLGVSVKLEDIERKCLRAQQVPGEQNAFLRLHLDIWTEQADRWLDMDTWDACAGDVPYAGLAARLQGQPCYAGIDLSATKDITAVELVFPEDDEYVILSYFFVPESGVLERSKRDRVPYDQWVDEGYIEATPGNVVDYDRIRKRLNELKKVYNIRGVAMDRWNATQLSTQLEGDGFNVVFMGQGFASMTAPTKEFEKLLLAGQLRHGANPVLRWMASNVAVEQDAAGNLKPSKKASTEKIDGIVAAIMALDQATRHEPPRPVLDIGFMPDPDDDYGGKPQFRGIRGKVF